MGENVNFRNFPMDTMLPLDMLAEVASETLKNDPTLSFKRDFSKKRTSINSNSKESPKRSASNNEKMTLDQIRILSDKSLLELFSEQSSNEIRKVFSYKCYLLPEKCNETFSSFGSENKSRLQMKSHLVSHIAELISEANSPESKGEFIFEAEPLHIKKKKMMDAGSKKRKKVKPFVKKEKPKLQKPVLEKKMATPKSKVMKNVVGKKTTKVINKNRTFSAVSMFSGLFSARMRKKISQTISNMDKVEKENERYRALMEEAFLSFRNTESCHANFTADEEKNFNYVVSKKMKSDIPEVSIKTFKQVINETKMKNMSNDLSLTQRKDVLNFEGKPTPKKHMWPNSAESIFSNCIKSESLVHLLHDHTYTSIHGKTFIEPFAKSGKRIDKARKEGRYGLTKNTGVPLQFVISTPPFPYVYVPVLPQVCEIREIGNKSQSYAKIDRGNSSNEICNESSCNLPEINKAVDCKKVNGNISQDLDTETEDDENVPHHFSASNHLDGKFQEYERNISIISDRMDETEMKDNILPDSTPVAERKLALKCIRQLRTKKKEERGPLVCRICKDKSFTAQATLMYHYRSHAGIKPFSCSVCDATFTRQHSLNYHMLIHNNKSRFVCSDCGRNFRHPSHYKEHLRRHTGETPYQCTDCNLRFKTRNTYKRHLKTRHGKILTARGIRILSLEEFDKVRTSPRKRISKDLLSHKMKDLEWQGINSADVQLQVRQSLTKLELLQH